LGFRIKGEKKVFPALLHSLHPLRRKKGRGAVESAIFRRRGPQGREKSPKEKKAGVCSPLGSEIWRGNTLAFVVCLIGKSRGRRLLAGDEGKKEAAPRPRRNGREQGADLDQLLEKEGEGNRQRKNEESRAKKKGGGSWQRRSFTTSCPSERKKGRGCFEFNDALRRKKGKINDPTR